MTVTFEIQQESLDNQDVRKGLLHTENGDIQTPTVIPYAKNGLVSPLTSLELAQTGCQSLAVDILPLTVQPGVATLKSMPSIGNFLGWSRPVISFVDQFPVVEKLKKNAAALGVRYNEPYTNAHKRITSQQAQQMQRLVDADIQLPLFQNVDYYAPVDDLETALKINLAWQEQSNSSWGVISGAGLKELRQTYCTQLRRKDGYLIGNLPDDQTEWERIVRESVKLLPNNKPRMVVATSNEQIGIALLAGVDVIITGVPIEMAHLGCTYLNNKVEKVGYEQYQADNTMIKIINQNEINLAYLHYLSHIHSSVGDHLLGLRNWRWLNSYFDKLRRDIGTETKLRCDVLY